jgi:hypothetical protein
MISKNLCFKSIKIRGLSMKAMQELIKQIFGVEEFTVEWNRDNSDDEGRPVS